MNNNNIDKKWTGSEEIDKTITKKGNHYIMLTGRCL